jgi:hypothetical protein
MIGFGSPAVVPAPCLPRLRPQDAVDALVVRRLPINLLSHVI